MSFKVLVLLLLLDLAVSSIYLSVKPKVPKVHGGVRGGRSQREFDEDQGRFSNNRKQEGWGTLSGEFEKHRN
jgi:hypothetical protein